MAWRISMELELICYTMGREVITKEDVEAPVRTVHVTNRIFWEMVTAIVAGIRGRRWISEDLLTLEGRRCGSCF